MFFWICKTYSCISLKTCLFTLSGLHAIGFSWMKVNFTLVGIIVSKSCNSMRHLRCACACVCVWVSVCYISFIVAVLSCLFNCKLLAFFLPTWSGTITVHLYTTAQLIGLDVYSFFKPAMLHLYIGCVENRSLLISNVGTKFRSASSINRSVRESMCHGGAWTYCDSIFVFSSSRSYL